MTPTSPISISEAAQAWTEAQRRRRKPLAEATIASYCDAWASFSRWALQHDRQSSADIIATDLGAWIDTLANCSDGTTITYSHGALAVAKYLADRGMLGCELALLLSLIHI